MKEKEYIKLTESKFGDLQAGYNTQIDDILIQKEQNIEYINGSQIRLDDIQKEIKNLEEQIDEIIYDIKRINNTIVHKEHSITKAISHYNDQLVEREHLDEKCKSGVINRSKCDDLNRDITDNMKKDKLAIKRYNESIIALSKRKEELKNELNRLKRRSKSLFKEKKNLDKNMKIASKNVKLCDRNLNSVHSVRSSADKLFLMTTDTQGIAADIFVPKIKKMKKRK